MNQGKLPLPDIKVNGVDGTYNANTSEYLNVTANLNARNYTDRADWWVLLLLNGNWFYLKTYGDWQPTPDPSTSTPFLRAPLQNLNFSIFSGRLPAGIYTLYFGVDITEDGVLNDPLIYDSITIIVQGL